MDDGCPTKRSVNKRCSVAASWDRAFSKYSPTKEILFSPVKATSTNLRNKFFRGDKYVRIHVWIVNMSESFYYNNTLVMLNSAKKSDDLIKKTLRSNSKKINWEYLKKLKDITQLGKGSFGSVYSATDSNLNRKYAIKYIGRDMELLLQHCSLLLDYLSERNGVIQAMNSPFVTKFYYSFQNERIPGLFLFFEFCIGSLKTYVSNLKRVSSFLISDWLRNGRKRVLQDLDRDDKVIDISLMYIFELFCALDFLVSVNIVHRDIKLDNILISETLHLKIADFGLIYRSKPIHRKTNCLLVTPNQINRVESSNYDVEIAGTFIYEDFETHLANLMEDDEDFFEDIFGSEEFDTPGINYDIETLQASFLTDTWAAGVVAVSLLFHGFRLFDYDSMPVGFYQQMYRLNDETFILSLVGMQSVYSEYIERGFEMAGGEPHKELMNFLASIFRPKQTRASGFTKEKKIYFLTKQRTVQYIDLEKVEQIRSFRDRNFNSKNVITLEVPNKIREMFETTKTPNFTTFAKWLQELSKDSNGKQIMNFEPGIQINYFS